MSAVASFLKRPAVLRFFRKYPSAAGALMLGYSLVNRVAWTGARKATRDRPWYATALFGTQQHYANDLFSSTTLCGLLVGGTSNSQVRTPVGVTCWRCALLKRLGGEAA